MADDHVALERTRDWLARADRARDMGDTPTADWCMDQAYWHIANSPDAERIKAAIQRLEPDRA